MREDERKMKKRNRKEAQQLKKKPNKNTPMPDMEDMNIQHTLKLIINF